MTRCLLLASLFLFNAAAHTEDLGDYNLPEARTPMTTDLTPLLMEREADPAALDAFKRAHPAGFWLFGERRDRAVRTNRFPAVWLTSEGQRAFGAFHGTAQPGEYYVFQVVIVGGSQAPAKTIRYTVEADGFWNRLLGRKPDVTCFSLEGIGSDGLPFTKTLPWPSEGAVKPLWFGVQVPQDASGTRSFTLIIGGQRFPVSLTIEGKPLPDGGIHEGWRLARLKWLNSTLAQSDTEVTAPFTPISLDRSSRTLALLGRTLILGPNGLPTQYTSAFNGSNTRILPHQAQEAFTVAPDFSIGMPFIPKTFAFTHVSPVAVCWEATSQTENQAFTLTVAGKLEYDGFLNLRMTVSTQKENASYDRAALTFSLTPEASRFAMGLGLQGGYTPPRLNWTWDVAKHQDALWIGGVNQGLMIRLKGANYQRPLINAYYDFRPLRLPESWGSGGVSFTKDHAQTSLSFYGGPQTLKAGEQRVYDTDWYLTPFKPIDPAFHFANRYYHSPQGYGLEDFQKLRKEGHTVFNIHHNRPTNPFINYPYNDLSLPRLKDQVQAAHEANTKLKVYYTTREITQNMPEFLALLSLDGEVILPRRPGVAWPVTNRKGPHPWLTAHAGDNLVPAWRETIKYPEYKGMLDLAVITTPDTRWNNFYLEGLRYLIQEAHIDGLYIDDTALDRKSMQRARRILDQDGSHKRLIDMHSWNHYNSLAKWANSDICFMELYPYYDSLWHGEGNFTMNRSPDFILTEMSGICYGLMSEQLSGTNIWRGLVFGMLIRRPWSGDSRPAWKILDTFGMIPGTDLIGWWDPATPIHPSDKDILATLYRRPDGKCLLAVANFSNTAKTFTLNEDWKALGLNPENTLWKAPESKGFQTAATFRPGEAIKLPPARGLLLIATPRK